MTETETTILIEETMDSYYNYVQKIEQGCQIIVDNLRNGTFGVAMESIVNLSEGLEWLLEVEQQLLYQSYQIQSNVKASTNLYYEINRCIELAQFEQMAILFEEQMKPLFKNAKSWRFERITS